MAKEKDFSSATPTKDLPLPPAPTEDLPLSLALTEDLSLSPAPTKDLPLSPAITTLPAVPDVCALEHTQIKKDPPNTQCHWDA